MHTLTRTSAKHCPWIRYGRRRDLMLFQFARKKALDQATLPPPLRLRRRQRRRLKLGFGGGVRNDLEHRIVQCPTMSQLGQKLKSSMRAYVFRFTPRLCGNSEVGLARRTFVSNRLNKKRTSLSVSVESSKERKQFCAFSTRRRFHTACPGSGHQTDRLPCPFRANKRLVHRNNLTAYSITSSARASSARAARQARISAIRLRLMKPDLFFWSRVVLTCVN
jgi:hypothetical protein